MTNQVAPEPPNSNLTECSIEEFLAIKAWTEKEIRRRLDRWHQEELFVAELHADIKLAELTEARRRPIPLSSEK